eukprot:g10719.t1
MSDELSFNEDWEEWDRQDNFLNHMVAGSIAGITEHTVMYPVDTFKTYVQCMRECPEAVAGKRVMEMVRGQGLLRLWRGVGTMFTGCVPAHALYFSVLEHCKDRLGVNEPGHHPAGAAVAGAVATVFHDAVMTPMDVVKQRLQLGYHNGMLDCMLTIRRTEGTQAFYRSFPTTLFMNIPYGCVMVAVNESLKRALRPAGDYDTQTFLLAGSGAGAVAAAATNPLDVVKTRLQTQALRAPAPSAAGVAAAVAGTKGEGVAVGTRGGIALPQFLRAGGSGAAAGGGGGGAAGQHGRVLGATQGTGIHSAAARCATGRCGAEKPVVTLQYQGLLDAARQIHAAEGAAGFFRGALPRLLVHMPSVAISWTTYETVKVWLSEGASRGTH